MSSIIATKTNYLDARHCAELHSKRGLDPKWCEVNCRSITASEATKHLGYTANSDGIWLEGANQQGQFKPNKPWKSLNDNKAPKYRNTLGSADIMLPIHPDDNYFWSNLEALKTLCYTIDGHPYIVITEGFFKAIALTSNGVPCISLLGVENGLTGSGDDPQGKRYLVPGLERLARAGFGFMIGFDADAQTNQKVATAQVKLAHQLKKFNVPVYSITGLWMVEQGKGIDDYIQMNGADKFKKEVLAKAVSIDTWEKQFSTDLEKKVITQSTMSKEIAANYRTKLAWHVSNKAWYQYEFIHKGVWSEIPEEELHAIVIAEINKHTPHFKFEMVSSITKFLKSELRINWWEVRSSFICLKDCVLDIAMLKEYSHEPGYRFLSSLPYKWSDRVLGCEPIKEWMLEVCEGRHEWVQVLRAAMKATVCERGGDLQRFMELVGFGGTGKGSIIRLVTALVGKENIAVTDLKQLEKNRFETAALYGKKAIIITDSERYAGDVSVLKALTGNDEVRHEKKGIQQTGGFRFKGMVWIAANEAIQSADYTSGLKRRRLSMPFDRVVPSHLRRDLESEFQPYLANFLQWVLEMPDAEVLDYVRNTDKTVRSLASFNAEILLETNPIALWADSYLVLDPKGKTYVGNKGMNSEYFLFASYTNWAETAGYSPVAQARFSRNLLDLLKSQLGITEATKGRDNKGAYITGVSIRYSNNLAPKRLITSEELVTGCNNLSDSLVTDKVTVQTLVSEGFFESDGLITNSNLSDTHELEVSDNKKDLSEFYQDASHPSNPSPVMVATDSKPVTQDAKTHHYRTLLSLMIEVWDDIAALGKLVLAASESDLVAATVHCNPQQIAHIKAAARSMWRPGVNRDVDYSGDRCSVWEAGGREITIHTPGGTRLKVKEGSLRPWLGI